MPTKWRSYREQRHCDVTSLYYDRQTGPGAHLMAYVHTGTPRMLDRLLYVLLRTGWIDVQRSQIGSLALRHVWYRILAGGRFWSPPPSKQKSWVRPCVHAS